MKNNFKRIIAFLMLAIILLASVSCNSSTSDTNTDTDTSTNTGNSSNQGSTNSTYNPVLVPDTIKYNATYKQFCLTRLYRFESFS